MLLKGLSMACRSDGLPGTPFNTSELPGKRVRVTEDGTSGDAVARGTDTFGTPEILTENDKRNSEGLFPKLRMRQSELRK